MKEACVPVFKEWLDTANPDGNTANAVSSNNTLSFLTEKQLVLNMLKAANDKEMRIQRAAEELLQPDVLPNVQDWLTKTTEKG